MLRTEGGVDRGMKRGKENGDTTGVSIIDEMVEIGVATDRERECQRDGGKEGWCLEEEHRIENGDKSDDRIGERINCRGHI